MLEVAQKTMKQSAQMNHEEKKAEKVNLFGIKKDDVISKASNVFSSLDKSKELQAPFLTHTKPENKFSEGK